MKIDIKLLINFIDDIENEMSFVLGAITKKNKERYFINKRKYQDLRDEVLYKMCIGIQQKYGESELNLQDNKEKK